MIDKFLNALGPALNKTVFAWFGVRLVGVKYFEDMKQKARLGQGLAADGLSREVDDFLKIKNGFPVNSLVCKGENLWPGIRFWLWRVYRARKFGNIAARLAPLRLQLPPYWRKHYQKTGIACEPAALPTEQADFLFFVNQNGVEQTNTADGLYNRITDPVLEAARSVGSVRKIEVVKNSVALNRKRVHPPEFVIAPGSQTVGTYHDMEMCEEFILWGEAQTRIKTFRQDLTTFVDHYFFAKEFYGAILDRVKPSVVLCMGFEFHQELFAAAHERGVRTVDLQHGNQTGWGPLYRCWEEMPEEGYAALPDYFWVWGRRDLEHLSESIPSPAHRPIIGGYDWLRRQRDFSTGLPAHISKRVQGKRVFLISMQNQPVFPELFAAMVNDQPDDNIWIIRRHPKLKCNLSAIRRCANVLVGADVDKAMLVDLLELCDAHVTGGSSVVIEAAALGVPSLIADEDGVSNFEDLFARGAAHPVFSIEEFRRWRDAHFSGAAAPDASGTLDPETRRFVAESGAELARAALGELLRGAGRGKPVEKGRRAVE